MDLLRPIRAFWDELNPATLSGAIDVIVVRQPDGSLLSTPFHVRFGKLTLFRPKERVVNIRVNQEPVGELIEMKVSKRGECYFVQPIGTDLPDCQSDEQEEMEEEDDEEDEEDEEDEDDEEQEQEEQEENKRGNNKTRPAKEAERRGGGALPHGDKGDKDEEYAETGALHGGVEESDLAEVRAQHDVDGGGGDEAGYEREHETDDEDVTARNTADDDSTGEHSDDRTQRERGQSALRKKRGEMLRYAIAKERRNRRGRGGDASGHPDDDGDEDDDSADNDSDEEEKYGRSGHSDYDDGDGAGDDGGGERGAPNAYASQIPNVLHSQPATSARSERRRTISAGGGTNGSRSAVVQHIHEPSPHSRGFSSIRANSSSIGHSLGAIADSPTPSLGVIRRSDSMPPHSGSSGHGGGRDGGGAGGATSPSPSPSPSPAIRSHSQQPRCRNRALVQHANNHIEPGVQQPITLPGSRIDVLANAYGLRRTRSSHTVCTSNPSDVLGKASLPKSMQGLSHYASSPPLAGGLHGVVPHKHRGDYMDDGDANGELNEVVFGYSDTVAQQRRQLLKQRRGGKKGPRSAASKTKGKGKRNARGAHSSKDSRHSRYHSDTGMGLHPVEKPSASAARATAATVASPSSSTSSLATVKRENSRGDVRRAVWRKEKGMAWRIGAESGESAGEGGSDAGTPDKNSRGGAGTSAYALRRSAKGDRPASTIPSHPMDEGQLHKEASRRRRRSDLPQMGNSRAAEGDAVQAATSTTAPVDAGSLVLQELLQRSAIDDSVTRLSDASTPTPSDDRGEGGLNVALSLCGLSANTTEEEMAKKFEEKRVTFDMLCERPNLLDNGSLVVRIHQRYLAWKVAAPAIMAQLVFGKPLPPDTVDQLVEKHHPRARSWFFWSRPPTREEKEPESTKVAQPPEPTTATETDGDTSANESMDSSRDSERTSADESFLATHRRSLYLTSEQLGSLHLKDGVNEIEFSVASKFQGRAVITCHVYLWNHDSKVVVSDIDGTITRSDVLGHAAALVGTDWTQRGVASLYSRIAANGYHFVYLSSRSISQSGQTKDYILNILQDTRALPEGPILLSPSSLFRSFHREVILRRPEEFKISCLSSVKRLFPGKENPLVAGFGNRHTDVVTYRAVGIADSKIFIVDPKGLLRVSRGAYESSYDKLSDIVDQVFPAIGTSRTDELHPEFSNFNYWRIPPPTLSAAEEEMLKL